MVEYYCVCERMLEYSGGQKSLDNISSLYYTVHGSSCAQNTMSLMLAYLAEELF